MTCNIGWKDCIIAMRLINKGLLNFHLDTFSILQNGQISFREEVEEADNGDNFGT